MWFSIVWRDLAARNAVVLITQMLSDRNFRFILITIIIDKRVFTVEDPFIPCVGDYIVIIVIESIFDGGNNGTNF